MTVTRIILYASRAPRDNNKTTGPPPCVTEDVRARQIAKQQAIGDDDDDDDDNGRRDASIYINERQRRWLRHQRYTHTRAPHTLKLYEKQPSAATAAAVFVVRLRRTLTAATAELGSLRAP